MFFPLRSVCTCDTENLKVQGISAKLIVLYRCSTGLMCRILQGLVGEFYEIRWKTCYLCGVDWRSAPN